VACKDLLVKPAKIDMVHEDDFFIYVIDIFFSTENERFLFAQNL
jgi:hypothetical protein